MEMKMENIVFVKMEQEETIDDDQQQQTMDNTGSDEVDALADVEEEDDGRVVRLVYVEAYGSPRCSKKQSSTPQPHPSRVLDKNTRDDKIRGILASLPVLKPVPPPVIKPSLISTPAPNCRVQSTKRTKKTNNNNDNKKEKINLPKVLQLNSAFTFDDVLWLVQHEDGEEIDENFEIQVLSDDEFNNDGALNNDNVEEEEEVNDEALQALLQQDDFCHIKESDNELIITIDNSSTVASGEVNPPLKIMNPVTIDSKSLMAPPRKLPTALPSHNWRPKPFISEMFSQKKQLEPKFITSSPEYFCSDCNKAFTTHFSLQRHNAIQHGILDKNKSHFKCERCGKIFFCKDELNRHMIKAHNCPNAILHRCHLCGRLFPSKYELARHKVKIHEPQTIPCEFCDKKFSRYFLLKDHQKRNHNTPYTAKCRTCNEMILYTQMENHMATEHPQKLQCNFCNKIFLKQILLARHLNEEHGVSFSCGKCGRADFISEEEFAQHACF